MKTIVCEKCGKAFNVSDSVPRVYCSCGDQKRLHTSSTAKKSSALFSDEERKRRTIVLRCKHRGEAIRGLDCGCDGNPQVYLCAIYGECARLRLSRMSEEEKAKLRFCNECDSAEV